VGYTPLSLTLYFVPYGGKALDGVTVTGEAIADSALSAGIVTAGGEAATTGYTYQWLRSRYEDEGYELISGATGKDYRPVEADKGYYIRLRVTGEGSTIYGEALSAAKGPVVSIIDEVFAAIVTAYLGENTGAYVVTKKLNLIKSLAAYPGVTIAWTADPSGVVNTDTGEVTRPDDGDAQVKLTATLSGLVAASRDFEINVLMQGVDNVEQTGTDARFKDGYPRSFMKNNTIWVEFELKVDAQVYLLVNASNGQIETTDPQSVLNGHASTDYGSGTLDPIWVDDSPVFFAEANTLVSYDTGYGFWSGREARLDFVLTDRDDRAKDIGEVVTIHYDAATASELDTEGPYTRDAFLNVAKNAIYIYFDETIASKGLSASDFTLNDGTVLSAEIHNYAGVAVDSYWEGPAMSYIKLVVSGITGAVEDIELSYIGGTVTDTSPNRNEAEAFTLDKYGWPVMSAATSIEDVYIGNDGHSLGLDVNGGPHIEEFLSHNEWNDMGVLFTFTQDDSEISVSKVEWIYRIGGITYMLKFDTPLNNTLKVTYNMASEPNWAYDTEGSITKEIDGNMTDKAIVPAISYDTDERQFKLVYDADLEVEGDIACLIDGFVVSIDGTEYRLRGFNAYRSWDDVNAVIIVLNDGHDDYLSYIAGLLESAPDTALSYNLAHGTYIHEQLIDIGGALLPAFGPQSVTITN
jgi:hypothetical protein